MACRYQGNLTISLSPEIDITIPNHQLVVPMYRYNDQGAITQINASTQREVLISSLLHGRTSNLPILGHPFLTSTYFMVDQDQGQFTIAGVNATTDHKPVSIGPPTCEGTKSISTPTSGAPSGGSTPMGSSSTPLLISTPTSGAPSGGSTPMGSPSTPLPTSTHETVSKGATAGIAVGGAAAVAILCLGATVFLRRRRHSPQQPLPQMGVPNRDTKRDTEHSDPTYRLFKPEMDSGHEHQPPAEMPLEQHPPYRLAPHEMDTI